MKKASTKTVRRRNTKRAPEPRPRIALEGVSESAWKLARLCAAYSEGQANQLFRRDWAGTPPPAGEHPGRALIYETLSLLFHCQAVVEDTLALAQIQKKAALYSSEVLAKMAKDRISEAQIRDLQFYGSETLQRIEADPKFSALADTSGKVTVAKIRFYVLPEPKWNNHRNKLWEEMVSRRGQNDLRLSKTRVALFEAQFLAAQFVEFTAPEKRKIARENRQKGAMKAREKKKPNTWKRKKPFGG